MQAVFSTWQMFSSSSCRSRCSVDCLWLLPYSTLAFQNVASVRRQLKAGSMLYTRYCMSYVCLAELLPYLACVIAGTLTGGIYRDAQDRLLWQRMSSLHMKQLAMSRKALLLCSSCFERLCCDVQTSPVLACRGYTDGKLAVRGSVGTSLASLLCPLSFQ